MNPWNINPVWLRNRLQRVTKTYYNKWDEITCTDCGPLGAWDPLKAKHKDECIWKQLELLQ